MRVLGTLAFMGLFAGNDNGSQVSVDGSMPKAGSEYYVRQDLVPANHFAAIGQPVVLGREFMADDQRGTQTVGVIDQTFARKYFGKANPLAKRVWYDEFPASDPVRTKAVRRFPDC